MGTTRYLFQQEQNEMMLRDLVKAAGGTFFTMTKAIADISVPTIKSVRPVASYKGTLTLGDVGKFPDTSLQLEVERYPKIMPVKAPSAKSVVVKPEFGSDAVGPSAPPPVAARPEEDESLAAAVKRARSYQVDDASAPGGKRDVDGEQLERGYVYGRTAVNVSKEDMEVATIPTWQCLDIVGFVSAKSVSAWLSKVRPNGASSIDTWK
jgi:ATP-dependent DNA helicase 2 subunit 2